MKGYIATSVETYFPKNEIYQKYCRNFGLGVPFLSKNPQDIILKFTIFRLFSFSTLVFKGFAVSGMFFVRS